MEWTKDQAKVVSLRERNILVSAAAGSGKTTVLVARIIKKILNSKKPVDIDRLLVVTFTKAAAAEMKSRIRKVLGKRLEEYPEDENLQHQLSLLHNAQITTIDSFCQYIIRNYFHVIGLEPTFQVGDETDLKLMKEDVLKDLLEERFGEARQSGRQSFLDFVEIFAPGRSDKQIEELVLKLYHNSQSYPWPEEALQSWDAMYQIESMEILMQAEWMQALVQDTKEELSNYLDIAKEAQELCLEEGGPEVYLPAIQSDMQQIEGMLAARDYLELQAVFAAFNPDRLKAARSKEIDPAKRDLVKELRNTYIKEGIQKKQKELFFQTAEEMLHDIQAMSSPVHELVQLTLDFANAYSERKREEGIIDFNDMEHFALEILTKRDAAGNTLPSETAKELQEHYEEILTDEYQDSNFVQEMILSSLCRAPEQSPYLFMVGDVKQSIYQFRLARPDLFMQKYNSYDTAESKTQRIDLQQNFRSRERVLESANYLFERLIRKDFGGIAYDDAAKLVPGAVFAESEQKNAGIPEVGQTEVILIEEKTETASELGKRAMEAAAIAERIRNLVQGEEALYVRDDDEYRPIEYRDIVILLRSLSGWSEEFLETLTNMGIPAYSATKTGYFSTLEVETVLNFLRVIDNPRQDIPLAAVLRSCLFQISDEELAYLGSIRGRVNYWDAICRVLEEKEVTVASEQEAAGEHPSAGIEEEIGISAEALEKLRVDLSAFMDMLSRYQEFAKTASVYELLGRIYRETGYYSMMSAMPAGEKRAANLDILLQQSVEFAKNGHSGIFEFCRHIESLRKSNIDFGEASVNGENTNAVQIMSIHKSKGLEFPVVFVAGLGKQFNLMDVKQSSVIDIDYGIGVEYMDLELRYKQPTLLRQFMIAHTRQSILTEEVRILYVALTRAKEKLILTGTASNLPKKMEGWTQKGKFLNRMTLLSARTYLDWIMPALSGRPAYTACAGQMECFAETENISSGNQDDLYRMELQWPQSILEAEAEELKKDLLRKQELLNWDDSRVYDQKMADAIERQMGYKYPYQNEQGLPVKISVSELKRRFMIQAARLEETSDGTVLPEVEIKEAALSEIPDGKEAHAVWIFGEKSEIVPEIPRPTFRTGEKQVSGAERGTLYHLVMEHLPYQELHPEYDFDAMLETMVRDGYMSAEEKDLLRAKRFFHFVGTELGRRMRQAAENGTLRREQQFMLGVAAAEIEDVPSSEEMVLVQGIIDAYFEEEGELILVDYKTDQIERGEEEILAERYRVQLDYYARALEQLTGKRVRERIIYSFSLGKEIVL